MKGSKMSAILATSLTLCGVLGIVPVEHPQQIVPIDAYSPNVSPFAAPPTTNSLSDVNHYYNFIFRLSQTSVPGTPTAYPYANYLGTPASQGTSFSIVQPGDLKGYGLINFKGVVIVASDYIVYHSSAHTYTRAMSFGKMHFKEVTLITCYHVAYWSG